MAIASNLTPGTVASADYEIAQSPSLGGEIDVYLTGLPSLFLGIAKLTATATVSYEFINKQLQPALTGTVSKTATSAALPGVGTKFLTELAVGDRIQVPGGGGTETMFVDAIASDTALTVATAFANTAATQTATAFPSNPIVAFVMNELQADAAVVITLGDLSGTLTPSAYASNTTFNFGATRGVELVGVGTNLIDSADLPTITNAKRGARIGFVQLPKLSAYRLIGATKSKNVTPPVKTAKLVGRGLERNRYSKPGATAESKISISQINLNEDDGFMRFAGQRCVAMLEANRDEKILTSRSFLTNCVMGVSLTHPEFDGESEQGSDGMFQHMITLVAP